MYGVHIFTRLSEKGTCNVKGSRTYVSFAHPTIISEHLNSFVHEVH